MNYTVPYWALIGQHWTTFKLIGLHWTTLDIEHWSAFRYKGGLQLMSQRFLKRIANCQTWDQARRFALSITTC